MSRNNENALSIHLPMRYIDAELLRLVDLTKFRSNHRRCSVKKHSYKLRKFKGKHLYWSHFLIKLRPFRPATLSKRNSSTDVLT